MGNLPDPSSRPHEVLSTALQMPPHAQQSYVREVCGENRELVSEVEALTQATGETFVSDDPRSPGGASMSIPRSGQMIAHYQIVEKIGEGGMGAVFKAVDTNLGRTVAVKVISRPNITTGDKRRFFREARAASALNHPNIVTIYEYDSEAGMDFIAMEFVQGSSLDNLLKQNATPIPVLIEYARQVASALAKAHAAGIAHRDLKPANIMITSDGIAKVLDFGLAKHDRAAGADGPGETQALTQAGMIIGTPAYMAPEQVLGEVADSRSDIFSFGVILYEMLCGCRPFGGATAVATLAQIVNGVPPPVLQLNPAVTPRVAGLVDRCLRKDRTDRLASMNEAVSELSAALTSFAPSGRGRWLTSLTTGLILLISGALAIPMVRQKFFSSAALSSPRSSDDWVRAGRGYLARYDKKGYRDKAIESFQRAIELDKDDAMTYALLSETYLTHITGPKTDQLAKLALDSARKAIELNPYLAEAHAGAGNALLALSRFNEAAAELKSGLALNSENVTIHTGLGALYEKTGDPKRAEEEYHKAVSLAPEDWVAQGRLGTFLYGAGRIPEAIQVFQAGIGVTPDNAILNANLGACLHAVGRDDDAAAALQRSLEAVPSAQGFSNLGTLLYFAGRYRESAQAFERALSLDATSYIRWGNLGDAYRWSPGDRSKAAESYRRAIAIIREEIAKSPPDPDLESTLATYLAKSGDFKSALQQANAIPSSQNPDVLSNLALAYEVCHRRERALDCLNKSIRAGYSLKEVENEPELIELRKDPRYQGIAMQVAATQLR